MTTFTQLNARLKKFLMGWLLVLGLKECLVECATLCVKSEVMLLWDHSYITSARGLGLLVLKMARFVDVLGGSEKVKNHADQRCRRIIWMVHKDLNAPNWLNKQNNSTFNLQTSNQYLLIRYVEFRCNFVQNVCQMHFI